MKEFWKSFEARLLSRMVLAIEGEGTGGAGGNDGGGDASQSTAERALEFWDSGDEAQGKNGTEGAAANGEQGGADGKAAAAADGAGDDKTGKENQQQKDGQIPDEQLQADPRFKELNQFREEVQPLMDKYGIPDPKEMDLQLADSKVLYDIMSGKGTPSQLLDVMAQNAGWSRDQQSAIAQDLMGWLTKHGYLKDGQGAQSRGADGKFKDPLEEKVSGIEKSIEDQRKAADQAKETERQTKIFNTFRDQVGKLIEAKGLDKEDLDYYGREIRSLIKPEQFNAIVSRIEKGNFVDVNKLFDQIHTRETTRLKKWSDKQVSNATRREKTQPRTPAGGGPPSPKDGQQKRDLRSSEGRQAAALEEWDK
jgi:hypothetical protein